MREFHIATPAQEILPQLQYGVDNLTKPRGSLGRIEEVAIRLGLIQQSLRPTLRNPYNIVFAADHGIAAEGVSYSAPEVTRQMVLNFLRGGAGICMLCRQHGFKLRVVDCGVNGDFFVNENRCDGEDVEAKEGYSDGGRGGVKSGCREGGGEGSGVSEKRDSGVKASERLEESEGCLDVPGFIDRKIRRGTRNFLYEGAMTEEEFERAVEIGVEMVDEASADGCNVISFGEMGVANTSPSSIWMHLFTGIPLERCVGAGSGLNADGVAHKLEVLQQALNNFFQNHEAFATTAPTATAPVTGTSAATANSPTPTAGTLAATANSPTATATASSFDAKSSGDQNVAYLTSPKETIWDDSREKTSETHMDRGMALEIVRYFGGFEMVAAMGAMMRAAELGMTILVDGFIMTAVLLAVKQFYPEVQEYCIFGHAGDEAGHRLLLDFLGAEPLLALGMRLGEGTGAVAAYPILETAVRMLQEMTTWEEAGVTKYIDK